MAGIAGRRLDDGAARTQQALPLSVLDHGEADAVFHAAARVQLLELGENGGAEPLGDLVQPDQRGVADQVEDALDVLHCQAILVMLGGRT